MSASPATFAVGVAIGLLCGGGGVWLAAHDEPADAAVNALGPADTDSARLRERIATLEAELADRSLPPFGEAPERGDPGDVETPPTVPAASVQTPAGQPSQAERIARMRRASAAKHRGTPDQQKARDAFVAAQKATPGSSEHAAAIAELRGMLAGPSATLSANYLRILTRSDGITASVGRLLIGDFDSMQSGHPARASLAAVIAASLVDDPALPEFLERMTRDAEPRVRTYLASMVVDHPSAATQGFLLDLTRTDGDATVLRSAWNLRYVSAALNRGNAQPFAQAFERRLADGTLGVRLRGQAYVGLGHAALYDPESASASLARLRTTETDPALQSLAAKLERLVADRQLNPASIARAYRDWGTALRNSPTGAASK